MCAADPSGQDPSVAIVIPTFERRDLVCAAVQRLAKQDYRPLSLIVVVDGSVDGTADALRAIAMPYTLTLIEQPNAGLAAARNAGASAAAADILLFLDDDMMAEPDLVTQHVRAITKGADAVAGNIPLDRDAKANFLTQGIAQWAEEWAKSASTRPKLGPFDFNGGHFSIRRTVFERLGGFRTEFTAEGAYGKEDAEFAIRLLSDHTLVFNPDAIARQRYTVPPREYLQRGYLSGQADVSLANLHPERSQELQRLVAASRPIYDRTLRLLARIPLAATAACAAIGQLADRKVAQGSKTASLVARTFFAARRLGYWKGVQDAGGFPSSSRLLVLCYHAFLDDLDCDIMADYNMPPAVFAKQVETLQRRGFTFVSASSALALIADGTPLPKKSVLLTFDDCYAELLDIARDCLHPRRIPGLAFAVTGLASGTNEWDRKNGARKLDLLDWQGLQELREAGFTLGSHSRTHADLTQLDGDALTNELRGSANDFEANGLPRPDLFAFPFGSQDGRCRREAERAGYVCAMGLAEQFTGPDDDRFNLARVEILGRDTGWRFYLKTTFPRLSRILRWRSTLRRWQRRLAGMAQLSTGRADTA